MKTIYFFSTTFFFISSMYAQVLTFSEIDLNNVNAGFQNNGSFFNNSVNGMPAFEIPKGSGTNAIFSSMFWFAGDYPDSSIRVAGITSSNGFTDFYPGPHGTSYSPQYLSGYQNSLWSITQEEIEQYSNWWRACDANSPFANSFDCNAIPASEVPTNESLAKINNWPAHGNSNNDESYFLAPFYEDGSNPNNIFGKYEPEQGDYPLIKGCSATFMVQCDSQGENLPNDQNMDLEVRYLVYQFESEDAIDNTTFIELELINWGDDTIKNFVVGNYFDADLGGPNDDFFGSNPNKNLMYVYNADNNDLTDGASSGYDLNPPSVGIMCLSQPVTSIKQISEFSHGDNSSLLSRYNQLHGFWGNGTEIMDNNNQPTVFMYSENPNQSGSYSEFQLANPAGDRRGVMGINIGELLPSSNGIGEYSPDSILVSGGYNPIKITFAIVYAREENHLQSVDALFDVADLVQDFYTNGDLHCGLMSLETSELLEEQSFSLYPNPTNDLLTISIESIENYSGKIISITGKEAHSFSTTGKSTIIDCSHLENGMYILQLTDGSKIISKQFVKAD